MRHGTNAIRPLAGKRCQHENTHCWSVFAGASIGICSGKLLRGLSAVREGASFVGELVCSVFLIQRHVPHVVLAEDL